MRKDIIQQFLNHIINVNRFSRSTVKQYTAHLNDLHHYLSYIHGLEYTWSQVKAIDISNYIQQVSLRKPGITSIHNGKNTTITKSTVANYIKSITGFFKRYKIYIGDCIDIGTIPKIKVNKPKIEILNDEEMKELIDLPEKIEVRRSIALRNKLYFSMLYCTGCRASELLKIKLSDIDRENREIVVFGKGSKYRSVFVTKSVLDLLDEFLEAREEVSHNGLGIEIRPKKSEYVFIALDMNAYGKQLSYPRIMDIFLQYSQLLGRKIHAHMLRHSFATKMFRSGVKERHIQVALGHEYITTTQRYITVCNKELSDIHNKVFS